MSAATNAAMVAALASSPYTLSGGANAGLLLDDPEASPLIGLLVAGERVEIATAGAEGAALFTTHRVIIAEQLGIMSKRLGVKSFRRDCIVSYAIDPDKAVSLTLSGTFGQAILVFDAAFDPMTLSSWLGETLVGPQTDTGA